MLIFERLEHAIEHLTPWEHLLLEGKCDKDGTPLVVTKTIQAARTGLGRDLTALAVTMRELADRFEGFEPAPKGGPVAAELRGVIAGERARTMGEVKGAGAKPASSPQEIDHAHHRRERERRGRSSPRNQPGRSVVMLSTPRSMSRRATSTSLIVHA